MVSVNEVIFNQQISFRGRTLTLKGMEGSGGWATVERKGGNWQHMIGGWLKPILLGGGGGGGGGSSIFDITSLFYIRTQSLPLENGLGVGWGGGVVLDQNICWKVNVFRFIKKKKLELWSSDYSPTICLLVKYSKLKGRN